MADWHKNWTAIQKFLWSDDLCPHYGYRDEFQYSARGGYIKQVILR